MERGTHQSVLRVEEEGASDPSGGVPAGRSDALMVAETVHMDNEYTWFTWGERHHKWPVERNP